MDQSLKKKTRQKRASTSVEYKIHPEMKLTMSIKKAPICIINQEEADMHVWPGTA